MKKCFFILMVALIAIGALFVSCKNEVQAPAEELVSVSFDKDSSRSLSSNLEKFEPEKYYWKYAAKKADGSNLISGQTASYDEAGALWIKEGKPGFSDTQGKYKVQGFSQGLWNFTLYGYKNIGTEQNPVYKLVYSGETTGVLLNSTSNVHHVHVVVSPTQGADGTLEVKIVGDGKITLDPATPGLIPNTKVRLGIVRLVPGGDPEVVRALSFIEADYNQSLAAGTYQVTVQFTNDDASVIFASGSVVSTVYSNLRTTIKGNLTEVVTYADFGAEQNPDIITTTIGTATAIAEGSTSEAPVELVKKSPTATDKVTASLSNTAAQALIANLKEELDADATASSMMLNLSVDTTEATETTITYEIGMEAVLTYMKNTVETTTTSTVKEVEDFVTVVIDMQAGLTDVSVTHSGNDMTSGEQWAEKTSRTTLELSDFLANAGKEASPDPDGYYYYYEYSSNNSTVKDKATLYIKTKTFSPFKLSYTVPEAVAAIGSKTYTSLEDAFAASKAGDEILVLSKDIVAPTSVEIGTTCEAIKNASGNYNVRTIPAEIIIVNDSDTTETITTSLYGFARRVNSGTSYSGYTATLQGNVDLKGAEWEPIGTTANPFSGVFNGANHTISNFTLGGSGKDNPIGLFGYIKGTTSQQLNKDTVISSLYDENYTVTIPAEGIFGCVVKNLVVSGVTANTTANGWTAAAVGIIYDATVSNVQVKASSITATQKVGGVVAFVPDNCGAMILGCSTSSDVTVAATTGNHAAGILGRINSTDSRVIIANCTNNAMIDCHGVDGGGITGQGKGSLIYNCINNGYISGNLHLAGIIAETGDGGNAVIGCTNNGVINGGSNAASSASDSAAGIVAYCNGHTTVANCNNSNLVSGNCPSGSSAAVSGIAGSTGNSADIFIVNCFNSGELINIAPGGKTYEISNLNDTIQVGSPETITQLNTWLSQNDIVEITSLSNIGTDDVIAPTKANTLRLDGKDNQIKLDISGLNNAGHCIKVYATDSTIEISGVADNSDLIVYGDGNTICIPENRSIKSLSITGKSSTEKGFTIDNSGKIAGSISFGDGSTVTINNTSGASINGGINSIAHTACNITINNHGTITKNSGESGSSHTIDFDYTNHHVVINNHGKIENVGNSYVLLFYIGASLDYNAYEGSLLRKEGSSSFMVVNSTSTISVHYQSGSKYEIGGVQHDWTDYGQWAGHITVEPMNSLGD